MDSVFQVAQVQLGRIGLQRRCRTGPELLHQEARLIGHGKFRIRGSLMERLLQGRQDLPPQTGQQMLHDLQGGDPVMDRRRQHGGDGFHDPGQIRFLQRLRRHFPQGLHQHEGLLTFGAQPLQQGLCHDAQLMMSAAAEEAFGDLLQGVGDPVGMIGGDLPVRMQALLDIAVPDLRRLVQHCHHGRGQRGLGGVGRQLLAVPGAGIGENLTHDLAGPAADIAIGVHQQLIEERQDLLLVGPGHIGAVFVQQPQIGTQGRRRMLAPGLLQQLIEGAICGDGMHQLDVIGKGHPPQSAQSLIGGQQGRIPVGLGRQRHDLHLRRHALRQEIVLKVPQLAVDRPVAALLFLGHIRQLGENDIPALRQGVDLHDLLAVFAPMTPDTKIGIDQQQALHGKIFKFQIPGGMVGGHMADLLQTFAFQPAPGVVIVQIGDAAGISAAAAEFAHIMGKGGSGHQRQIHRQTGLFRQHTGVKRHIVDTDDMRGRIKGHTGPADSQKSHQVLPAHQLPEADILLRHTAGVYLFLRHRQQVGHGIKGRVFPFHDPFQRLHIGLGGLRQHRIHRPGGIGVQAQGQPVVDPWQPAAVRLLRHMGAADLQHHLAFFVPGRGKNLLQTGQQGIEIKGRHTHPSSIV